jgi:hypothetical protein
MEFWRKDETANEKNRALAALLDGSFFRWDEVWVLKQFAGEPIDESVFGVALERCLEPTGLCLALLRLLVACRRVPSAPIAAEYSICGPAIP